jgi:hypothetical protein
MPGGGGIIIRRESRAESCHCQWPTSLPGPAHRRRPGNEQHRDDQLEVGTVTTTSLSGVRA